MHEIPILKLARLKGRPKRSGEWSWMFRCNGCERTNIAAKNDLMPKLAVDMPETH